MLWNALIIAFVVTAATGDLLHRQIPRWLTVGGVVVGLGFHLVRGGLGLALLATFFAFTVGLILFRLGAIGGGDVKLITALGALLGLSRWSTAMEITIIVAGIIALLQAIYRGELRRTLHNILELMRWLPKAGLRAHPEINVRNPALLRAPFGVAAAVGTFLAVWQ